MAADGQVAAHSRAVGSEAAGPAPALPGLAPGGGLQIGRRPLLCFSHLRWNFVYQRPQHLMVRFARSAPVFFLEEPVPADQAAPSLALEETADGVVVAVPRLPPDLDEAGALAAQRLLLDRLCAAQGIVAPLLWYYTPMALGFSDHLRPALTVYDCMDELAAFRGAPAALQAREEELLRRADLVFTGGHSLYEAKRGRHPRVYAFPSGVDAAHFRQARAALPEPADLKAIPRPRIGHYAVLDERLDTGLLAAVAEARPDWQLVLIGPTAKIDPAALPRRPNLHYLGRKDYRELPAYLAGWDVAMMPFALNAATRFISPTKTPEYLAAGKPVVATPIADVIRSYGAGGLVRIAATPAEFVAAIEQSLRELPPSAAWLDRVDRLLDAMSWEATWAGMRDLLG